MACALPFLLPSRNMPGRGKQCRKTDAVRKMPLQGKSLLRSMPCRCAEGSSEKETLHRRKREEDEGTQEKTAEYRWWKSCSAGEQKNFQQIAHGSGKN